MVWECDTDLDGLKPYEEPDKGDKRVEVSDEEEGEQEGVKDKNKPSGENFKMAGFPIIDKFTKDSCGGIIFCILYGCFYNSTVDN